MGGRKELHDDDEEYCGEKLRAPPDFDGPITDERKSTDVMCSFLLFVAWGCFAYVGIWSYMNGDPQRILHPSDYKGRLCGYDKNDENNTTLPSKWAPVDYFGNGACISSCPNNTVLNPTDRSELICKDETDLLEMPGCTFNGDISSSPVELLVLCGGCMYPVASFDTPLDYCVPRSLSDVATQIDTIANASGFPSPIQNVALPNVIPYFEKFANDIYAARKVILGVGLGGSAALGFMFLLLMRVPGLVSATFWMSAFMVPAFLAWGGYYCMTLAERYEGMIAVGGVGAGSTSYFFANDTTVQVLRAFMYAGYIGAAAILCMLCCMRRRIVLAIGITRAAARSMVAVPLSPFYPLVQLAGYAAFLVPWFIAMVFLGGTGVPTVVSEDVFDGAFEISSTVTTYPETSVYFFWYMLFILFWTSQFIIALGQIALAICFSKWYFTSDKSSRIGVTVAGAHCTALCKHTGTAAFGALIIAILQFIRAVLMWVKRKIKEAGGGNPCVDVIFCCFQCILCCVEKCMKFISKNAYIQTALFGYPFCRGAREAFYIIVRNAARMAAVGFVSELSMVFCKMYIVAGISMASFYYVEEVYSQEVFSVVGVVALCAILSWFVADMFTEVLGIAVSTILQCFLVDEEMFGGHGSPFVPKELNSFLKQLDSY